MEAVKAVPVVRMLMPQLKSMHWQRLQDLRAGKVWKTI